MGGSLPLSKERLEEGKKYKFEIQSGGCCDEDYYVCRPINGELHKNLKIDLPSSYDAVDTKIPLLYPNSDGEFKDKSGVHIVIVDHKEDLKRDTEAFEVDDSDVSSEYSRDSDDDSDDVDVDVDVAKVKMKYKIVSKTKIYKDDECVGKIKLKINGKAKCKAKKITITETDEEGNEREREEFDTKSSGRPKKAKLKVSYKDDDLDIDYDKKNWKENSWNKKWECDHFKVDFRDHQCFLSTDSDDMHPLVSLAYGFIIG